MKAKKFLSLTLAAIFAAASFSLSSCGKVASDDETDITQGKSPSENTSVLTNVFKGSSLTIPKEYGDAINDTSPYFDEENRTITELFLTYDESTDDAGNYTYAVSYYLVTFDFDGKLVGEPEKLDFGQGFNYPQKMIISEDALVYLLQSSDSTSDKVNFSIVKYNRADKTTVSCDNLTDLYSGNNNYYYLSNLAVDKDENYYISSDSEILVLDKNFVKIASIPTNDYVQDMTTFRDGKVYIAGYFSSNSVSSAGGFGVKSVELAANGFGETFTLPSLLGSVEIYRSNDYDFYYSNTDGIYGFNTADQTSELIVSYQNSDISSDRLSSITILDKETFLASERDDNHESSEMIYKKSPDIDLSKVKVIEIATPNRLYELSPAVVKYNKSHTDSRIFLNDYSKYATDNDYTAGQTKLLNDVINGVYTPDIVVGNIGSDLISTLVEKDLFTDLYTLMDDSFKNDLFGGIKRSFETKDGKMWGICGKYTLNSLIAKSSDIDGREKWTLAEMLDFAANLPEGTELMNYLTKSSAPAYLLGNSGYGTYIDSDNNSCSFDSAEFIDYLNFLKTLPDDDKFDYESSFNSDDSYAPYREGKYALYQQYYYEIVSFLNQDVVFNTSEVTPIGYPVLDENDWGTTITQYTSSYVILNKSENSDLAFGFIKDFICSAGNVRYYSYDLPVTKTAFDESAEQFYDFEFVFYMDGSASWGSFDPEHPQTEETLDSPGIVRYFTKDDAEKIKDMLDNKVGARVISVPSAEITSIVNEEISAYLSGVNNAEETARVIQSRVSIWLAEHE